MSSRENSLVDLSKENRENTKKTSKFTRGEKCIFVHLVVTFVAILALVLAYAGHLLAAPHAGTELRVARRAAVVRAGARGATAEWLTLAGAVGVRGRRACGGVRVRARWAVAPAHCVAARAHPLLASDLPDWKIAYHLHGDLYVVSDIVRGIVHSHFNRDDFSNNIGLFEQADPIYMDDYKLVSTGVVEEDLQRHATDGDAAVVRGEGGADKPMGLPVNTIPSQRCRQYIAPVVELRSYEFCVHMHTKNVTIEHGAAVVFGSEIKGFVAWGDKSGTLPLVVLDISVYGEWIENIVHIYKSK